MASLENDSPSGISNSFFPGIIGNIVKRFSDHRETLGLQYPGTIENLSKEVQRDVFLTNHMFSGVRADLAKTFSASPIFQVAHAFAQGSQNLPPYAFLASFGTPKLYLQGNADNEGSVLARANYKWADWWTTKTQSQLSPSNSQFMIQMDQDFIGKDFSASIKTINPSILDGGVTGVFMGSYLQSVTPSLALGLEAMWSRASMQMGPESTVSYVARYRGSDWIATAQLAGMGTLNTSYWRRLTERVEVGSDLALQLQPDLSGRNGSFGGLQKQGNATLGAKYNFRTSIFRAQIDSTGKLGVLLDKFIFPTVQVTFAGEIDHLKQSAKVGVGVSVEIQSEDVIQSAENTTIIPPV